MLSDRQQWSIEIHVFFTILLLSWLVKSRPFATSSFSNSSASGQELILLTTSTDIDIVWHSGVKIVMKHATAGFMIYGAPIDQALF